MASLVSISSRRRARLTVLHLGAALVCLVLLAGCDLLRLRRPEEEDIQFDLNKVKLDLGRLRESQDQAFRRLEYSIEQIEKSIEAQGTAQGAFAKEVDAKLAGIREELDALSAALQDQAALTSSSMIAAAASDGRDTPTTSDAPSTAEQDKLIRSAEEEYSRGEYDKAIELYSQFLNDYAESANASKAAYYLARCYYDKQDYERALRAFNHVLEAYPASEIIPQTLHSRASCEYNLKKYKDTRATLIEIQTRFPNYEPERIKTILDQLPKE